MDSVGGDTKRSSVECMIMQSLHGISFVHLPVCGNGMQMSHWHVSQALRVLPEEFGPFQVLETITRTWLARMEKATEQEKMT
jgi:hypothetical protein